MATTVMGSVGAYLRELRTRRGVSLEEIARTTRVPQRYLESLEADAYEQLPAPVFIRGFIRAYCQALSESPQEALAFYDSREGRVPPPLPRSVPAPRPSESEPRSRGTIVVSLVLLVVLGMALFTVALVIQPRDRATNGEARPAAPPVETPASAPATPPAPTPVVTPPPVATTPPPAVTPPPAAVVRPPAAAPTPAPPSTPAAPAPAPRTPPPQSSAPAEGARPAVASVPAIETLLGSVSAPYRVTARVSDQTWVRVRTEDGRTTEETLAAGEVREWVSDRPLVLTIGNAAGVALELNGRTLPPLGGKGVVIPRLVLPPESR